RAIHDSFLFIYLNVSAHGFTEPFSEHHRPGDGLGLWSWGFHVRRQIGQFGEARSRLFDRRGSGPLLPRREVRERPDLANLTGSPEGAAKGSPKTRGPARHRVKNSTNNRPQEPNP